MLGLNLAMSVKKGLNNMIPFIVDIFKIFISIIIEKNTIFQCKPDPGTNPTLD